MKQHERDQVLEEAMKKEWDSLSSHLPYTYTKAGDGRNHHVKCIQEYAEQIARLSKLY